MSSLAAKPKRAAAPVASSANQEEEVITLLDSDDNDSDHGCSPRPSTSRTNSSALKSTNTRNMSSFVPFHLYATTTSKSKFQANDASKKYFRSLREIIGLETPKKQSTRRKFQWLIIFNYCIDFSYLMEKLLPDVLKFHRVVVFYGSAAGTEAMDQWKQLLAGSGNTVEFIQLVPSDPPRSRLNPLSIKIPYGVHHTKMFLMGYEENNQSMCRVVVHTANLLLGDIEYKTQGAYSQDFPLKHKDNGKKYSTKENQNGGEVSVVNPYKRKRVESNSGKQDTTKNSGWPFEDDDVPFEEDLVTYLESYQYLTRQAWCTSSSSKYSFGNKQMSWLQLIRQYDYSSAYAVLIPSVPGRHKEDSYHNFGYLKLRKAIVENVCPHQQDSKQPSSPPPILCQFSSIGSLNEKWLNQFLSAINYTSTRDFDPINNSQNNGRKGSKEKHHPPLSSRMKIIWPTVDEIRTSIEGYSGGGSVPGTIRNLSKDFLQPLFHRWSSRQSRSSSTTGKDPFKTARHIPHIKTFIQPSSSSNGIEWLTLTSHNLSIAAWGQLQTPSNNQSRANEKVLFIRHWELGVFISPATLAKVAPEEVGSDICIKPFPGNSAGDNNGVIHIDDSDDDEEDKNETPTVLVPLPFDLDPERYNGNDVPWACDRSCSVPDTFGCIMP